MTQEALKLALEALENAEYGDYDEKELNQAITAIKEALAYVKKLEEALATKIRHRYEDSPVALTLPTHHNITWANLTDEEIKHIEETTTCLGNESWLRNLTRAIEAKLKELNIPQRTWANLTDDEYFALQMKIKAPMISVQDYIDAMRMVEAKLKEKNGA